MKKALVIFGTRPEAIKTAPVILALSKKKSMETVTCLTGQHQNLASEVLSLFGIKPKYELHTMRKGQSLPRLTARIISELEKTAELERPDIILVHGDTATAFSAAITGFYLGIPIAHVEAGLRTYDISSPFPEELNRRAISLVSRLNFAPTEYAKQNLVSEGVPESTVTVTGNTVIDSMRFTKSKGKLPPLPESAQNKRIVLVTAHRRENIGKPLESICRAIKRAAEVFQDSAVIMPLHPNPSVRKTVLSILGESERIILTEPLGVCDFHRLISEAYLILTDSGGVQEEASALGKPTLVLRDTTERPEGLQNGPLRLVGTDENAVFGEISKLFTSESEYLKLNKPTNAFGDGSAAQKIADSVEKFLLGY